MAYTTDAFYSRLITRSNHRIYALDLERPLRDFNENLFVDHVVSRGTLATELVGEDRIDCNSSVYGYTERRCLGGIDFSEEQRRELAEKSRANEVNFTSGSKREEKSQD